MKERFNSLRHFEKNKGFQFFESKWKKTSSLWVILKILKKEVQLFDSFWEKMSHIRGKRFNSVSRIRISKKKFCESCSKKGFNSASHLSNGFNSFRHNEKRVQFFESYEKTSNIWVILKKTNTKKVQFFESYFLKMVWFFEFFKKKSHFLYFVQQKFNFLCCVQKNGFDSLSHTPKRKVRFCES